MQVSGDLESLQGALSKSGRAKDKVIGAGKCSALVKLLPNNAELFVSHDTWDDYQGMLRTYKLYDLKFSTAGNSQWCTSLILYVVQLISLLTQTHGPSQVTG